MYGGKRAGKIVCTVFVIIFYLWVNLFNGGRTVSWEYFHGIYIPLFRGLANISLGIILYNIYFNIKNYSRVWINRIIELLSFMMAMIFMAMPFNYDTIAILFICIFILSILRKSSILEYIGKFFFVKRLYRYEYAVFLNHAVFVIVFEKYILNTYDFRILYKLLLLLSSVIVYSMFTQKFIDFLRGIKYKNFKQRSNERR